MQFGGKFYLTFFTLFSTRPIFSKGARMNPTVVISLPNQKRISNTLRILIPVKRPIRPPVNREQLTLAGGQSLKFLTQVGQGSCEGHPHVLLDGGDVSCRFLNFHVDGLAELVLAVVDQDRAVISVLQVQAVGDPGILGAAEDVRVPLVVKVEVELFIGVICKVQVLLLHRFCKTQHKFAAICLRVM